MFIFGQIFRFQALLSVDMFFHLANGSKDSEEKGIPQEVLDKVPEGVELVYWDYNEKNKAHYDKNLKAHKQFVNNKTAFAGGIAMPKAWLTQGILSKEVGAVQLLLPAMKIWMPRILIVTLFGGGAWAALSKQNTIRAMEDFKPTFWRAALLCLVTVWSVLSFNGVATFIYSNF